MNLTKMFESMDTDTDEKPDLAVSVDQKVPNLMIGVEAQFKKMKLQSSRIDVLATPDFEFFSGLKL
jgi:hypothetical protein